MPKLPPDHISGYGPDLTSAVVRITTQHRMNLPWSKLHKIERQSYVPVLLPARPTEDSLLCNVMHVCYVHFLDPEVGSQKPL